MLYEMTYLSTIDGEVTLNMQEWPTQCQPFYRSIVKALFAEADAVVGTRHNEVFTYTSSRTRFDGSKFVETISVRRLDRGVK